jgi:hypothetical protein
MSTSQNRDREHKWRLRVAGSARGPYSQAYILAALLTDKLPSTVSACLIDTGDWRIRAILESNDTSRTGSQILGHTG